VLKGQGHPLRNPPFHVKPLAAMDPRDSCQQAWTPQRGSRYRVFRGSKPRRSRRFFAGVSLSAPWRPRAPRSEMPALPRRTLLDAALAVPTNRCVSPVVAGRAWVSTHATGPPSFPPVTPIRSYVPPAETHSPTRSRHRRIPKNSSKDGFACRAFARTEVTEADTRYLLDPTEGTPHKARTHSFGAGATPCRRRS
jgi:hypothetical protein